jgi:hypothetical protein
MQCVLGSWRCVIDTTRTCQRTEPPACTDGEEMGPCNLGICPGGTPVPASQTCIGGHYRCLPIEPGCPAVEQDAGTPPPDAGSTFNVIPPVSTSETYYGGFPPWYRMGMYILVPVTEALSLDRVAVRWTGPSSCLNGIAIANPTDDSDNLLGQASTAGVNEADVALNSPMSVPLTGAAIEIRVRFNAPVASGVNPDDCIRGSSIEFSIASGITTGAWDSHYVGRYNLRMTGVTSGQRVYTDNVPHAANTAIVTVLPRTP